MLRAFALTLLTVHRRIEQTPVSGIVPSNIGSLLPNAEDVRTYALKLGCALTELGAGLVVWN